MQATMVKPKGRGGAGRGQGRKPGAKTKERLVFAKTKEEALALFQKRAFKMTNDILTAQKIVAIGSHKMIRMYKDDEGMPHVETIRDVERMQQLIDEGEYGVEYLIVEGSPPDFRAGDAILNRALGKPTEVVELSGRDGKPLIISLDK